MRGCDFSKDVPLTNEGRPSNLKTWARNLTGAALLSMQIIGCQPASINKPKSPKPTAEQSQKQGWVAKSYRRFEERNEALGRVKMVFYNNPETACIEGDRGIPWIRKLYRRLLLSWAEKFCSYEKYTVFDEDISECDRKKGKHPAQCVACDDSPSALDR